MGLFSIFGSKKTTSEKVGSNRELISENERSIDALILLAGDNEEIVNKLKEVKEKIKYLIPSDNPKVAEYDTKIKNFIEDMRIALVKAEGEFDKKVKSILMQIELAIADRNSKL